MTTRRRARCEKLLLEALRAWGCGGASGGQSARTPIDRGGLGQLQIGESVRGGDRRVGRRLNSAPPVGLRQRCVPSPTRGDASA